MSFVTNKSLKVALEGVKSELDKNLPTKVSQLENDSQYITEENIYTREQIGWLLDSINSSLDTKANKSELSNKVDKVNGKQLSTNDFTTELKNKLNSLVNYDDTDLKERINEVTERLNILIGNDDVSAIIDTFNEIEDFLSGITNKETLTGLLQDLKSEIVSLCADTYLPLSGGKINSVVVAPIRLNTNKTQNVVVYTINDEDKTSVGYSETNGSYIYSYVADKRLGIKNNGIPHFDNKELLHTGNYSSTIFKGTSSQFLKADGSVDSTNYLPATGMFNKGESPTITAIGNENGGNAITYKINNSDNTYQGGFGCYWQKNVYNYHYIGWGERPYSLENNLAISPDNITYKNNKVWHEGNDGSGSGLDADLLDGKQPADLNVGSSNKLQSLSKTTIAAEDETYNYGLELWRVSAANAANLPVRDNANVIIDIHRSGVGTRYSSQLGFTSSGFFYRSFSGADQNTTTSWREVAFIDSNVASASRLKPIQLTNEDLDTLKESQLTFYLCEVANTCTNKPEGVVQFSLVVYYCGHGYIAQILTSHTGVMYKRRYDGATKTWSAWQQLAITDGAVARLTPQRLIDEDLNTLVAGFKVYYAVNTTHNNAPANAKYFSLEVFNASGDITQVANLANGTSYRRKYQNNTWSAWKKMLTEDDLPTAKSLTTEDLNTLKTPNTSYYANTGNTCKNKPVDATNGTDYTKVGFGLEVSKVASKILQTIIIEDGSRYFRFFANNSWEMWRQLMTDQEMGISNALAIEMISALSERIEALENKR